MEQNLFNLAQNLGTNVSELSNVFDWGSKESSYLFVRGINKERNSF